MKIENPILRALVLAVSVTAMTLAVVKAQGCQSSPGEVDDPPEAVATPVAEETSPQSAPTTEEPTGATNGTTNGAPTVDPSAPAETADAGSADIGPIEPRRVFPATKSGAFFHAEPEPEPQQQQAPPPPQMQNASPK